MKNLKLVTLIVTAMALFFTTAMAESGKCWTPKHPVCPAGISSDNGKQCGPGAVIVISEETEQSVLAFCLAKSKRCKGKGECNQLVNITAVWREVYCVRGDEIIRRLGRCLDQEISRVKSDFDCDGKACNKTTIPIGVDLQ